MKELLGARVPQKFKLLGVLNSGLVVAGPDLDSIEEPTVLQSQASGSFGFLSRLLSSPPTPPAKAAPQAGPRRLFVPYDMERELLVLGIVVLGRDSFKFCNITGVEPGQGFKGILEPTAFSIEENSMQVFTKVDLTERMTNLQCNARFSFKGNKKRSEVVLHELILN